MKSLVNLFKLEVAVLLKTDMLGYLNIDVDYLDADGD